jgi:hypothetical protein
MLAAGDVTAMTETCTVDAELFESLQEAIDFVAACGGGIVYTELADTLFAKSLKLPDGVQLEAKRPIAA